MFANLKKKIESEVGDLSRLAPNLRSITHSEKLTPLSSRHNSVSSLASETSYSNKISSPISPSDRDAPQSLYGGGASKMESGSSNVNRSASDNSQQKIKRVYEEKLQTQELDFAWRLNSKDEEITKLQKQVEHMNSVLHSKEFETQQKLVRVQEDMDSLEGFSQQENAKIKHLLLNREEELCQLRATVMMRDSAISDYESQIKGVTVENDRLKKSLDEVVGRQGNFGQPKEVKEDDDSKNILKLNEERLKAVESEKEELQKTLKLKDVQIEKLHSDIQTIKRAGEVEADNFRKENSFVLKELKEQTIKLDKISKENDQKNSDFIAIQQDLESARNILEAKDSELSETLLTVRKLQETNGALTLQLVSKAQESSDNELGALKTDFEALKSNFSHLERELQTKDDIAKKLEHELQAYKNQSDALTRQSEMEKVEILNQLQNKSSRCDELSLEIERCRIEVQQTEDQLKSLQLATKQIEIDYKEKIEELQLQKTVQLEEFTQESGGASDLQLENEQLKVELERMSLKCTDLETQITEKNESLNALNLEIKNLTEEQINLECELKEANESLNAVQLQSKLKLNEYFVKSEKLDQANQKLVSELTSITSNNSDLASSLKDKENVVNQLQSEFKKVTEEKNGLIQEILTLQNDLSTTRDKCRANVENIEELQRSNEKQNVGFQKSSEKCASLQQQINENQAVISSLQSELTVSLEQNIKREAELIEATESLNLLTPELAKKEAELDSLNIKFQAVEQQLISSSVDTKELSKTAETIKMLEAELAEKDESVSQLEIQLQDFGNVEIENNDLVLQISEIQSKCDELEEENKFLKESVQPNEDDALKRKLAELEGELLDKNQVLKQQSHQLQDLRRSLAKEINKNQAVENAATNETTSPCNGLMSQSSSTALSMSSMQPPTLPPQETDVNFMYLRSVLFKYLTTTDAQVTHQLTRVVATLLHLTEEEAHLLTMSAESRNSWMTHLITKS